VSVIRTNDGYRLAADGLDLDALDDVDFSFCAMVAIPSAATRTTWRTIFGRNNTDDFGLMVGETDAGWYVAANNGAIAPCATGCDEDDILNAVCFSADVDCGNPVCPDYYVVDDDQCASNVGLEFQWSGSGFTQVGDVIGFGCNDDGSSCQDAYIAQVMVLDRTITEAEVFEFYQTGIDGTSWSKTAPASCD
jgi:hypothetical protein